MFHIDEVVVLILCFFC